MSSMKLKSGWVPGAIAMLIGLSACSQNAVVDVEKPSAITFEASPDEMLSALEGVCETAELRKIEPVTLPGTTTQQQIDCQGFDYFGSPRKAEFVFRNGELILVWIMLDDADLDRLDAAFVDAFGAADIKGDEIAVFIDDFAAVRHVPAEALYYSPSVASLVEAQANASIADQ